MIVKSKEVEILPGDASDSVKLRLFIPSLKWIQNWQAENNAKEWDEQKKEWVDIELTHGDKSRLNRGYVMFLDEKKALDEYIDKVFHIENKHITKEEFKAYILDGDSYFWKNYNAIYGVAFANA